MCKILFALNVMYELLKFAQNIPLLSCINYVSQIINVRKKGNIRPVFLDEMYFLLKKI